jgi:lipoprotein-releasing system permease protein
MTLSLRFVLRYLRSPEKGSFSSYTSKLAIIGLSIGVTALMLTASIIRGFENTLSDKLSGFDGMVRVQHMLGHSIANNTSVLDSLIGQFPLSIESEPYIRKGAMIRVGNKAEGILVEGIDHLPTGPEYDMHKSEISSDKIILGKALRSVLGVEVGDRVIISGLETMMQPGAGQRISSVEIEGFFHSGMLEYDKTMAFVSLSQARTIFNMESQITGYIINSDEPLKDVMDYFIENLSYPYYAESWQDRHRILFDWINVQRWPALIIFGMIALVGIVNILATMAMIVIEKSGQVGMLMAQGMHRRTIRKIFLLQSSAIGIIGGIIGTCVAGLFIFLQSRYHIIAVPEDIYFMDHIPVHADPGMFLLILSGTLIVCLLASLWPTKAVMDILPADVLRYE